MSITWNINATVLDLEKGTVSISANRIDSLMPTTIKTYTIASANILDDRQKAEVIQGLWDLHAADMIREKRIAKLLSGLNDSAKVELEAREAKEVVTDG